MPAEAGTVIPRLVVDATLVDVHVLSYNLLRRSQQIRMANQAVQELGVIEQVWGVVLVNFPDTLEEICPGFRHHRLISRNHNATLDELFLPVLPELGHAVPRVLDFSGAEQPGHHNKAIFFEEGELFLVQGTLRAVSTLGPDHWIITRQKLGFGTLRETRKVGLVGASLCIPHRRLGGRSLQRLKHPSPRRAGRTWRPAAQHCRRVVRVLVNSFGFHEIKSPKIDE
mmetsp:Transcript_9351/g.21693  ORF Transcript_9351/g.21693 Transcript_9351/m.21693 type:complete len:226 (+) Transcript_9351:524-1201(+)